MANEVFLGYALFTDQGDWTEGSTAQTNDIFHTADGVFMSTIDNNTTAPGVGVEGWKVWFDERAIKKAEADRKTAEAEREKQEAARQSTFNKNETTRQQTFETNESARQQAFVNSETTRQQTFDSKEAERDAAIEEVTTFEARLAETETQTSSHDHDIDAIVETRLGAPDYNVLPLLCGQPPILFGAGTPQEAIVPINWRQFDPETGEGYNWNGLPSAIGQQYINTSVDTGGRYIAIPGANGALAWKNM